MFKQKNVYVNNKKQKEMSALIYGNALSGSGGGSPLILIFSITILAIVLYFLLRKKKKDNEDFEKIVVKPETIEAKNRNVVVITTETDQLWYKIVKKQNNKSGKGTTTVTKHMKPSSVLLEGTTLKLTIGDIKERSMKVHISPNYLPPGTYKMIGIEYYSETETRIRKIKNAGIITVV
jgi:hypothetical protein